MFQAGVFDTTSVRSSTILGNMSICLRIPFHRGYDAPPSVLVGLAGFDLDCRGLKLQVSATNVDRTGFTINIDSWNDNSCSISAVQAQWIAYPSNHPGVSKGQFQGYSKRGFEGTVRFDRQFRNRPKIFTALTRIDTREHYNAPGRIGLRVVTDNIQTQQMDWKIEHWDTPPNDIAVSYLALDFGDSSD